MNMYRKQQRAERTGFTLIEVALAVVVVGIGVLGLFALISTGLDASAKAVATTQASYFAAASLNALRAEAVKEAQATNWAGFWDPFKAGVKTLTVPAPAAWVPGSELKIYGDGKVRAITFLNRTSHTDTPSDSKIPTGTLRYKVTVTELASARQIKSVALQVWPGAGSSKTPDYKAALSFYSEFPDVGSL